MTRRVPDDAPEAWSPGKRALERVVGPLLQFLHIEAASGIVLLVAAVAALLWANLSGSYDQIWHAPVTLGIGSLVFSSSVHFWINDGLMVVFFFVVGLEIRREMHEGELSEPRRAALPIAAALGGMLFPALIFLAQNHGLSSQRGWGVPMATDIAFAVGVLALLGKRVPTALRVLLLALAIIDDIGAIIVIALFYSTGLSLAGVLLALGGVAGVLILQRLGARRSLAYVVPGFVLWLGCLRAGIHPTVAGVILGLLTPAQAWFGERGFLVKVGQALDDFRGHAARDEHRPEDLFPALGDVKQAQREAVAPVVRLQASLHPWVAFVIMPLFALANAGVSLEGLRFDAPETVPVMTGVGLGLIVGKPLGVLALSFLAVRLRIALLPTGVSWTGIALVGAVAGIGFTMALFIAGLAFSDPASLGVAKLAILIASVVAGGSTLLMGKLLLPPVREQQPLRPEAASAGQE